jgi:hypothetical protein
MSAKAGGDIVMLNTSADNSPTQHVLEAALAERLNAEAAILARKCEDFEAMTAPGTTTGIDPAGRDRAVTELMEKAKGLCGRYVIGTCRRRGPGSADHRGRPALTGLRLAPSGTNRTARH